MMYVKNQHAVLCSSVVCYTEDYHQFYLKYIVFTHNFSVRWKIVSLFFSNTSLLSCVVVYFVEIFVLFIQPFFCIESQSAWERTTITEEIYSMLFCSLLFSFRGTRQCDCFCTLYFGTARVWYLNYWSAYGNCVFLCDRSRTRSASAYLQSDHDLRFFAIKSVISQLLSYNNKWYRSSWKMDTSLFRNNVNLVTLSYPVLLPTHYSLLHCFADLRVN